MDQIFMISTKSPGVRQRFLEVQQMLKPPATLFAPGVVARVLWSLIWPIHFATQESPARTPLRSRTMAW